MLGSRVSSTIRNLFALAEPGLSSPTPSPSQSGSAGIPEGNPFAVVSYVPPALMKKTRPGGPLTTGVPCNPETGVGLLAAVAEPASARLLRVAEPVRAGASGIMAAVRADLNCNGTSDTALLVPIRVNEALLACKLCHRGLDDRTIYMYMDKGFCKPECRYEYYLLEELYEKRQKLAAETRPSKRARRDCKASLHTEGADRSFRRIFLAPDDSGSFLP
ncbi:hypothetical protein BAE44_0017082 [Dichanthelium oligosanthes]|uniref:FLZ-type domain-containing protein n=1 Tax=Dichanthelium oligosanthes TaxID=888268 RepID=A0A1E5VA04_9POAL|nr:hypothetical protein BAE44_0017082 [Dichanthelium oligosanthes]